MESQPDSSLIIGVATTTAERVQLARLLSGADALLLVSSAEQARAFLDLTTAAESTSVVRSTTPAAQIEAVLPMSEVKPPEQQPREAAGR